MTKDQQEKFFARAAQLGHDRKSLVRDRVQRTTVTVKSVEEFRKLVQPMDENDRAARQREIEATMAGKPLTVTEHVHSYLYGTGTLSEKHMAYAQGGFPMQVDLVSTLDDHTMPHGETTVGPSGNPTVWNYGTLNFYPDSYLTVKNTYFTLNATNLVMQYSGS